MRYQLIIFDMDGTLTEELLDYDAIRVQLKLPSGRPILEQIGLLPAEEQAQALATLHELEIDAAGRCVAREGARELLEGLRRRGVKIALLTRNSPACTDLTLSRHGLAEHLDHISTRLDQPYKPHPEAILRICRKFDIPLEQTLMVGDYLFDLQAAEAAGVDSVLVCTKDEAERPWFADKATFVVQTLRPVEDLLND